MTSDRSCETCAVRNRALCGALSKDEITLISQIAHKRKFSAGETILSDSEPPAFFANILTGFVKLTKILADGRQQIVGLQFPSEFIGRPFAVRSPYFAEAGSDVELCCYDKRRFEALVRDHPSLEHRMFENTLDELDAARGWLLLLGRKTAEEKVASFLLLIAQRSKDTGCEGKGSMNFAAFDLPLSRAEMGDYLGLTIETVSRQMTSLKKHGLIELEGSRHVVVPDIGRLESAAEKDR